MHSVSSDTPFAYDVPRVKSQESRSHSKKNAFPSSQSPLKQLIGTCCIAKRHYSSELKHAWYGTLLQPASWSMVLDF